MTKITFDMNTLKSMALFEAMTHARVKDCITEGNFMLFVVEAGEIGKAIGHHGVMIKRLEDALKKNVRVAEFSTVPETFFANLVGPHRVRDVKIEDKIMLVTPSDLTARGMMIGHGASILRFNENVIKRYFDKAVSEIKIGPA